MFDRDVYLIKEHVGLFRLTDTYDILDPSTGLKLAVAREEPASWIRALRLLLGWRFLPTRINVYVGESPLPALSIFKGFALFRPRVRAEDGQGMEIGCFQAKLMSLGGAFSILDKDGTRFAEVKGDWKGWNYRLLDLSGRDMGIVTKKWAGIGKELFTSADNYVVSLVPGMMTDRKNTRELLLAAVLAIDIIYKEGGR
jgi:uncharacterized protein YxjI